MNKTLLLLLIATLLLVATSCSQDVTQSEEYKALQKENEKLKEEVEELTQEKTAAKVADELSKPFEIPLPLQVVGVLTHEYPAFVFDADTDNNLIMILYPSDKIQDQVYTLFKESPGSNAALDDFKSISEHISIYDKSLYLGIQVGDDKHIVLQNGELLEP